MATKPRELWGMVAAICPGNHTRPPVSRVEKDVHHGYYAIVSPTRQPNGANREQLGIKTLFRAGFSAFQAMHPKLQL